MNKTDFQQLAEERILDAEALLAAGRWSCAYYVAGYAVECALKCCIISYLQGTDTWQSQEFSRKCWTHDLNSLLAMAELTTSMTADWITDPLLESNWNLVKDWKESSRYEARSEQHARDLITAITSLDGGVLAWVKLHW